MKVTASGQARGHFSSAGYRPGHQHQHAGHQPSPDPHHANIVKHRGELFLRCSRNRRRAARTVGCREGNHLAGRDQHPRELKSPFLRRGAGLNTIDAAALSLPGARHAVATHFSTTIPLSPDPDNLCSISRFHAADAARPHLLRIGLLLATILFNRPRMKFDRHAAVGHRRVGFGRRSCSPFGELVLTTSPSWLSPSSASARARAFKVAGSPGRTISLCSFARITLSPGHDAQLYGSGAPRRPATRFEQANGPGR